MGSTADAHSVEPWRREEATDMPESPILVPVNAPLEGSQVVGDAKKREHARQVEAELEDLANQVGFTLSYRRRADGPPSARSSRGYVQFAASGSRASEMTFANSAAGPRTSRYQEDSSAVATMIASAAR